MTLLSTKGKGPIIIKDTKPKQKKEKKKCPICKKKKIYVLPSGSEICMNSNCPYDTT